MTSWLAWITCPTCDRQLSFVTGGKATDEGRRVTAIFECDHCGTEEHLVATLDRIQQSRRLPDGQTALDHVLRHAAGAFTAPQMIELTRLSKDAVYQACKRGADMGVLEIVGTTVDGNITYRRTM